MNAASLPPLRLPAERWERLPAYMTPAKIGERQQETNVWPVGYVTERNPDGSAAAYNVPVAVTGCQERADQVAQALNVATHPNVANARALLASVTKGKALTGDAARLALHLSNVLATINGEETPFARPASAPDTLTRLQVQAAIAETENEVAGWINAAEQWGGNGALGFLCGVLSGKVTSGRE